MPSAVQVLEDMAKPDRDRNILIFVNPTGTDLSQHAIQMHPRLIQLKRCLHTEHAWVGHDLTLTRAAPPHQSETTP
jgi:hypothetical protein